MTAAAPIRCDSCGRRIGRRGRHHVVCGTGLVLCTACVASADVHRDVYLACRDRGHSCLDHGAYAVTRASVVRLRQ